MKDWGAVVKDDWGIKDGEDRSVWVGDGRG